MCPFHAQNYGFFLHWSSLRKLTVFRSANGQWRHGLILYQEVTFLVLPAAGEMSPSFLRLPRPAACLPARLQDGLISTLEGLPFPGRMGREGSRRCPCHQEIQIRGRVKMGSSLLMGRHHFGNFNKDGLFLCRVGSTF